jgi:hypothetical protein
MAERCQPCGSARVLTQEQLKEHLQYDPETGTFIRIDSKRSDLVGRFAGRHDKRGRVMIGLAGKEYFGHRLAWLYMTGQFPETGIDHIDCDCRNNKWSNLRIANQSQNNANARKQRNKSSRFKGVYYNRERMRWSAKITINRTQVLLGHFENEEAAAAAYIERAREIFGQYARPF